MDAVLRFVERGLGVAIVPAMVLIDRPGLRSVRLGGPTLDRTISVARPADVAPTAAVEVMRRTITAERHGVRGSSGRDHATRRGERVTFGSSGGENRYFEHAAPHVGIRIWRSRYHLRPPLP